MLKYFLMQNIPETGASTPATLLNDLRASGQTSARTDRGRGLTGKAFARRMRSALGEKPKATFEVVYGHAWKAPRAERPNVKTVRVFKNIS